MYDFWLIRQDVLSWLSIIDHLYIKIEGFLFVLCYLFNMNLAYFGKIFILLMSF